MWPIQAVCLDGMAFDIRAVTFSLARVYDLCMYFGGNARGNSGRRGEHTVPAEYILLTEQILVAIRLANQKGQTKDFFESKREVDSAGAHMAAPCLSTCRKGKYPPPPPGADHGPACLVGLSEKRVEREGGEERQSLSCPSRGQEAKIVNEGDEN